MKRIASVLLIFAFLFNCFGWQLVLFSLQKKMHEANWDNSPQTEEEFVVIKDGKNVTLLNSHELSVNGKLFDIKKTLNIPEGTVYVCVHDGKEEALEGTMLGKTHEGKEKSILLKLIKLKQNAAYTFDTKPPIIRDESSSVSKEAAMSYFEELSSSPPYSPPEA
jgi:hypothetical protein